MLSLDIDSVLRTKGMSVVKKRFIDVLVKLGICKRRVVRYYWNTDSGRESVYAVEEEE